MDPQEYEMGDLGVDDNVEISYAEAIRILDSMADVRQEYNSRAAYLRTLHEEAPEFLHILEGVYSEKIDAFLQIITLIGELGEQNNLARQLSEIRNDVTSGTQRISQLIAERVRLEEEKTEYEMTAKWTQQDSQEDIPALAILRDIKNTSYGGIQKKDLFTSCGENILRIGGSVRGINNQILEISKNIDVLKKKMRVLIEENRVLLGQIRDRLAQARVIIDFLQDLEKKIDDFKTLSTDNTLHALAIRGDTAHDEIVRLLSEGCSPNDLDPLRSKKPIYYACMCGRVRLATLFVDVTEFNNEDKRKILEELPNIKELWELRSIIEYGTTNFNRLWNPNGGIEENIIRIFKDYYSPVIFDRYGLFGGGFLGEQLRLILTGAWHRHNIPDAQRIVTLFTSFAGNQFPETLIAVFEGEVGKYVRKADINHEGTFYKRLMFVLQQFNKKRYKSSSERVNLPSLPLDISEGDRGSQKIERGSQKVERGSQKIEKSPQKIERGSQKVLPSIQLDVFEEDRDRKEGESVYNNVAPGLRYQSVPGDGHCLFNAVALYCGRTQQALRTLVVRHIESHMEEYCDIIQALNPEKKPELYLQDVRQGIEWADNLEIVVLMTILNRPIVVVGTDGKIRNLSDLSGDGVPIFVQYNGHNHYDALILTGERGAREIFEVLRQLTEYSQEARNPSPLLFSSITNRQAQERQQEERDLEESQNRSWETYQREHGPFANDAEREIAFTNFRQEWDNELRARRTSNNLM